MKMNLWSLLKDQSTFVYQGVTRTYVTQQRYGRVNTKHGFYLDTSHLPNCGTTQFNRSAESLEQRHILTKRCILSQCLLKCSWCWNICNGSWWEDGCSEGIWLDVKAHNCFDMQNVQCVQYVHIKCAICVECAKYAKCNAQRRVCKQCNQLVMFS